MKHRVIIIGAGNMGSSLVRGLYRAKADCEIYAVDEHENKLHDLKAEIPKLTVSSDLGSLAGELWGSGSRQRPAAKGNVGSRKTAGAGIDDVLVLCIKPQDLARTAKILAGSLPPSLVVVTILAGVPIADVATALKHSGAIIRGMPNIAAMVGAAATALAPSSNCSDAARSSAEMIFASVGSVSWAREDHLDAVTGLSGSGPAYIYMVIEALTDGGVKMGLPRELAARLSAQTVLGSAMLVQQTGLHPAILRDQVTTPGGTTINAIHELESHGLRAMLISAVATATLRAATLRENSQTSK